MSRPSIRLEAAEIDGGRIRYRFTSGLPFFTRPEFSVEYLSGLAEKPPAAIAAVPFAAVMAPLTWMAGADLEIPELDARYVESLGKARAYFNKWFPRWSSGGQLRTAPVRAGVAPAGDGLLFSGGLDALTSFIRLRARKPELFSVFGADIPILERKLIEDCKAYFLRFSNEHGVGMHFIETDLVEMIRKDKIRRYSVNWWGQVAHGLILTALPAPSHFRRLKTLSIASSHKAGEAHYGWGSDYDLDPHLGWAGTDINHDFHDVNRFEKAVFFKDHPEVHPYLRVCFSFYFLDRKSTRNCSKCEKCYRTICELLLNDVDPNACNFEVSEATFRELRWKMSRPHSFHTFFGGEESTLVFWDEIRSAIGDKTAWKSPGAAEFFAWLKSYPDFRKAYPRWLSALLVAVRKARWELYLKRRQGKKP